MFGAPTHAGDRSSGPWWLLSLLRYAETAMGHGRSSASSEVGPQRMRSSAAAGYRQGRRRSAGIEIQRVTASPPSFYPPSFRGGGGGRRAALSTAVVDGCLEGQVDRRDCEDGSDPCPTAPGTAPGRQAFLAKKLGSGHRDPAVEPPNGYGTIELEASSAVKSRCELLPSRTPFNRRSSG